MTTKDLTAWTRIVENVAMAVSNDFPNIEREDVTQDLYLFILEKKQLVDPEQQGAVTALTRRAQNYAWTQRKEHLMVSVQYAYRPTDVRKLLETMFQYSNWEKAEVPDDAKSLKGNDPIELSSDVAWAFSKLRGPYQEVIASAYRDQNPPAHGSAEHKRLSRAIKALVDILNSYERGGHSRKAMPNSKAQHIISNAWSGND